MQQSITVNQYKSLSETASKKWKLWCLEHGYGSAFAEDEFVEDIQPTIGMLIEFLNDKTKFGWSIVIGKSVDSVHPENLCTDLWETAKEILES